MTQFKIKEKNKNKRFTVINGVVVGGAVTIWIVCVINALFQTSLKLSHGRKQNMFTNRSKYNEANIHLTRFLSGYF